MIARYLRARFSKNFLWTCHPVSFVLRPPILSNYTEHRCDNTARSAVFHTVFGGKLCAYFFFGKLFRLWMRKTHSVLPTFQTKFLVSEFRLTPNDIRTGVTGVNEQNKNVSKTFSKNNNDFPACQMYICKITFSIHHNRICFTKANRTHQKPFLNYL